MRMKLLLVGCGKMGAAILERVTSIAEIVVVDPAKPPDVASSASIAWHSDPAHIAPDFHPDIILLAVKPQQMAGTLPAYARHRQSVFVSIAAGLTLVWFAGRLGENQPIIRVMTNLPASVGAGTSVAIANAATTPAQRELAQSLLQQIGSVAWLEQESLIDAVTALSGSGPAYIFALCDSMAKAGAALGLPQELAMQLARQTVIGSGTLLAHSAQSAEALCQAVASPGGTTEAALKVLLAANGLTLLIEKTMQAAAARSRQLAQLS